jgi:hypothetical protein
MPATDCFRYPTDVPLSVRNRDAGQRVLPGLRRMPSICFSYSAAARLGIRRRNAAQSGPGDLPSPPGKQPDSFSSACLSYPVHHCFRY